MKVYASHHALDLTENVDGMPLEYVFYAAHKEEVRVIEEKITTLEHQNAVLERVIARQDVMLMAGSEYDAR